MVWAALTDFSSLTSLCPCLSLGVLFSPAQGGTIGGSTDDDLRLVEVGVRCSLEQMLEEGFYHAGVQRENQRMRA